MEYKRTLLGAAGILALGVGMQSANASTNPADGLTGHRVTQEGRSVFAGDALLEFVIQTGGVFTADKVDAALGGIFANMSPARAEELPDFLVQLASLGVTRDIVESARETLLTRVAASGLPTELIKRVSESISGDPAEVRLAANNARDERCDPLKQHKNDPNCPPEETGTTDGTPAPTPLGGGGYSG